MDEFKSTPYIEYSGPLFEGKLDTELAAFIDLATEDIAKVGVTDVQIQLDRVLVNPSGHYRSQIQQEKQQTDRSVNDSGVIYGPWLEGTGSRNATTRFKGYSTFRKVTRELQAKVVGIATRSMTTFIERMNS